MNWTFLISYVELAIIQSTCISVAW